MTMKTCPCGSNLKYDECCLPLIKGDKTAITAEQLMRSRYSAYVKKEVGYLRASLHPDHRSDFDEKITRAWAESSERHQQRSKLYFEIVELLRRKNIPQPAAPPPSDTPSAATA